MRNLGRLPANFGKDKTLYFRYGGNKKYSKGWDDVFGNRRKLSKCRCKTLKLKCTRSKEGLLVECKHCGKTWIEKD